MRMTTADWNTLAAFKSTCETRNNSSSSSKSTTTTKRVERHQLDYNPFVKHVATTTTNRRQQQSRASSEEQKGTSSLFWKLGNKNKQKKKREGSKHFSCIYLTTVPLKVAKRLPEKVSPYIEEFQPNNDDGRMELEHPNFSTSNAIIEPRSHPTDCFRHKKGNNQTSCATWWKYMTPLKESSCQNIGLEDRGWRNTLNDTTGMPSAKLRIWETLWHHRQINCKEIKKRGSRTQGHRDLRDTSASWKAEARWNPNLNTSIVKKEVIWEILTLTGYLEILRRHWHSLCVMMVLWLF